MIRPHPARGPSFYARRFPLRAMPEDVYGGGSLRYHFKDYRQARPGREFKMAKRRRGLQWGVMEGYPTP